MTQNREIRPDQEMENHVSSWLTDTDLKPHEADRGLERLLETFPTTPQARYRFLGRWFDRDEGARRRADEHDHPPDTNRRNRLMFSATGLVAALAVLAISVNVVNTDPAPPDAGAGATHTVDAAGGADFTKISEAVAAAVDGDTVLVQPGTYTEAIVIDTDITLMGEGSVEEIVIHAPEGGPVLGERLSGGSREPYSEPYAVLLVDTDTVLSGLTFQGKGAVVIVSGGAPTLTGLVVDEVGVAYEGGGGDPAGNSIVVNGGSTATVRGNKIIGGGPIAVFGLSEPLIEGNTLTGGPHIWGGYGDGTIIRGIYVGDRSSLLIEDNVITNPGADGLTLTTGSPTVRNNVISGSTSAGISLATRGEAILQGNELTDNSVGIQVKIGSPTLQDNLVEGNGRGIIVSAVASATLIGNTVCGNEENLVILGGAETIMEDNDICEDAPAG